MPILILDTKQRRELRSVAHALKPTVIIGDAGLTPAVLKEIDTHLTAHSLIKVRVSGDDRQIRLDILAQICEQLSCAEISHIGKILTLYRQGGDRALPATMKTTSSTSDTPKQYIPKKLAAVGKKTVHRRRRIKGNDEIIPKKPRSPRIVAGKVSHKKGASQQNPSSFVQRLQNRPSTKK